MFSNFRKFYKFFRLWQLLAFVVLLMGITSSRSQELEDIREYLALRDELIQIKGILEQSLGQELGTGIFTNPSIELNIKNRLDQIDGQISRIAKLSTPLASYYATRLQQLSDNCRSLFTVFVQRMALSTHIPAVTQGLASMVPFELQAPASHSSITISSSPNAFLASNAFFGITMSSNTSMASTSNMLAHPSHPSDAHAINSESSVDLTNKKPELIAYAAQINQADYTSTIIRQRREFFHPIGVRVLLDPKLSRNLRPSLPGQLSHVKPEPPPSIALPASMAEAMSSIVPAAGIQTTAPAGTITPAQTSIANVTVSKPSINYPNLPKSIDKNPVDITPLEPWTGADPQIREVPSMRPLAVMIENHAHARPQTALEEAEVVYEIPVEGGITRFMALFYHVPNIIGPVRSCREYFIDRAFEVNALYVHCGGSPKGYEYIGKTNIFAIDEITNGGPFFRDQTRKAPHNLYARGKDLIETANKRFPMQLPYQRLPLLYGSNPTTGNIPGRGLVIRYHGNYFVSYRYNPRYNRYDRFMNGLQHLDRITLRPVSPGTIILQEAAMRVVDEKGRQEISFFGSGKAFILYGGTLFRATWRKDGLRDFTRFYDENGKPVIFSNKAPVWIQVISPQTAIAFDPPYSESRFDAYSKNPSSEVPLVSMKERASELKETEKQ